MRHHSLLLTALALVATMLAPTETRADAKAAQLSAIGSHGASYIYTTYGYIGVLADAYVKEVYNAEKVEELMTEVVGIIDANKKNLEAVKAEGLSDADAVAINEMLEIYGLLQTQANALTKFAKTKDREAAVQFESTRKMVWPKIAKLLGLGGNSQASTGN